MAKAAQKGKSLGKDKKPSSQVPAEKFDAVLLAILQAVTATENLAELLAIIRNKLSGIVDTRNFFLALYHPETNSYTFPYCVDEYDVRNDFTPGQMQKSLTDYVRRSGQAQLVDEKKHRQLQSRGEVDLVGAPSKIWLGVPLKIAGSVIGVLVVQSYDSKTAYAQKDMDLFHLLADYIARAVEHRRVADELKMYRDQLEALVSERTLELELTNHRLEEEIDRHRQSEILQSALYQISEKASQAEDMDALFKAIHGIISSLLYARNFYIALTDLSGEMLSFPYFLDEFDARPKSKKLGRGLTEYVLKTGQPLLVSDQQVEQLAQDGLIDLIGAPSNEWLGVPLKRGERTFGVLVIQSYQEDFHYSERDRELLIFVSQHIAAALWNKQTARELALSERRYRTMFEESQDVIYMADINGNLIDINQAGVELFGYASRPELLQVNISRDLYENSRDGEKFLAAILISGYVKDFEVNLKTKTGKPVMALITARVEYNENDRVVGYRGIMRDITERKLLEQRYMQAQKMESIGLLAGGIAHDFNNILGGILGYASWMKTGIKEDDIFFKPVDTIEKSAQRAAELTGQLLAFARGGKYDIKAANLNSVIAESLKIISGTFDKSIVIETDLDKSLPTVEIDIGQIQQVLINLCVNARDAMPGGGRMTIQSALAVLGEDDVHSQLDARPGWFAVLTVSDTGIGMDDHVKQRIFEPFFTTKEKGKGTGLGLSMVYGVVKNHGGFVNVYSEVGDGSAFKIYLPLSGKPEVMERDSDEEMAGGHESILIIDDEEVIREVAGEILSSYGYRVQLAADGEEGVKIYKKQEPRSDLVILDMIMPRQGGRETLLKLKKINPAIKVLFSTGYSQNEKVNEIISLGVSGFIQKPYQVNNLLSKVREILDGKD
jgi:two-component system cell cycle sensor histidine kinase/response regulator CckA